MPMSTSDAPLPRRSREKPPPPEPPAAPPVPPVPAPEPTAPARVLAPGAESTDPTVQQLLAERQTAAENGDSAAADAVSERLAELGYR